MPPRKPEHCHGYHTGTSGEPTLSGDLVPSPLANLSIATIHEALATIPGLQVSLRPCGVVLPHP